MSKGTGFELKLVNNDLVINVIVEGEELLLQKMMDVVRNGEYIMFCVNNSSDHPQLSTISSFLPFSNNPAEEQQAFVRAIYDSKGDPFADHYSNLVVFLQNILKRKEVSNGL